MQGLNDVGMWEIFDQDCRPTFVIDLDPDLDEPAPTDKLAPLFGNTALTTYELLWDAVRGAGTSDAAYTGFRSWATSRSKFDDSGDVFPVTHVFHGMLWTGSTVRKRWRLISGNKLYDAVQTTLGDLSSGLPSETSGSSNPSLRAKQKERLIAMRPPQISPLADIVQESSTVITSQQATRSSEPQESSYSSVTNKSASLLNLDGEHLASDWTAPRPRGNLSTHAQFARTIDWASTPLGDMRGWSPEFKQVANLLMKNPHPAALFWGSDLTMMYNEAYKDVVAGRKHPSLMGTGFRGPFSETWDDLADLFMECARTGNSISMENQRLPMERHGFVEETYFTWSFTPLYGSGNKVLGFYNAPFETTQGVVQQRWSETLLHLGEETAKARTVNGYWQRVIAGLSLNIYDAPFALLYSVAVVDDGDSSSVSGSSTSLKSCILEGTLGVPAGHIAAPPRLDLKRSTEGFVPSFREAMRTREPTKLQTKDGTLPESLIEGIEWRGFEEPCREAVLFPIRPTNGENVMAFLLLGINPRRPYDKTYQAFMNMLNHQLATSLASIILFEEEVKRSKAAVEAAGKEKEQLSKQLADQTIRMQRMTEMSPVGMYFANGQGVLMEANDQFFQMTDFPRNYSKGLAFTEIMHPDSLHLAFEAWKCYSVDKTGWAGEMRLKKPWTDPNNGEVLENWIIATGQPEYDSDGSLQSVLGSITDISRIKWAENLQNRRLEDAEETRRQMNNFLDLTSHEMRNPLSAMIHCADEIQAVLRDVKMRCNQMKSNAIQELQGTLENALNDSIEAAETIAYCAQHQKSIVDDILTVSKLDSDLLVITPTLVQPTEVVHHAVKMFDAEMQKKDIKCEFVTDKSIEDLAVHSVYLDRSRLLQILINLITNAIKFTQDRERREIKVRVGASIDPPALGGFDFEYIATRLDVPKAINDPEFGKGELLCLAFQVEDTGCGLTPEEKQRLFTRFSQATPRTHAQYGGSGLGLFISRQLTELHGGQIGVGSEAGVGSIFAFYLRCRRASLNTTVPHVKDASPYLKQLNDIIPTKVETTQAVTPALSFEGLHVLVVEDNTVNQKVLRKQLEKLRCIVSVADHGVEALKHIEKSHFWHASSQNQPLSVILMDLEMPIMDGLTCVKQIRRFQEERRIVRHIPIIAVTANVRAELVNESKAAGMDDVVLKPFRIPELVDKIREVLGRNQS
ncbi:Hypothetical protein R9X50_00556500 [Acrodontium crateriforme]|uniref:histidine kinase n=1 Tax=Acrodontium crateriforme TaxID=150365 RepID=A0AAQ3R976_9PEZI|nr:Hypothetical protein R9X50_00556500 [Acrodontium crateriforme]